MRVLACEKQLCRRSNDFDPAGRLRDYRVAEGCFCQAQITILMITVHRIVVMVAVFMVVVFMVVVAVVGVALCVTKRKGFCLLFSTRTVVMIADDAKLNRHRHDRDDVYKF